MAEQHRILPTVGRWLCPSPTPPHSGMPPPFQVSPGSDGDWSLTLFPKDPETGRTLPALRRVFYEFQSGLARLSEEAQAHNDGAGERPFPYNYTLHSCDPAIMDTSISV